MSSPDPERRNGRFGESRDMFYSSKGGVRLGGDEATVAGLPEPGESIFYPKVGHCIFRGVIEDRAAPGTRLVELEDLEEGSRILIPLARVPELNLRSAGSGLEAIKAELSSEFEEPFPEEEERHRLLEELIAEGTPQSLARALKRLHFLRQTTGLSREEEQTRKKIRSWLAAEVALSKECTRAEAQAFMTRLLQDAMAAHRIKEKEEAKERRRAAKEQKKAESAAARVEASASPSESAESTTPSESETEDAPGANEADTAEIDDASPADTDADASDEESEASRS
jgi:RNA polymerase-interacting CarD/CdnL/TRCF family regulator